MWQLHKWNNRMPDCRRVALTSVASLAVVVTVQLPHPLAIVDNTASVSRRVAAACDCVFAGRPSATADGAAAAGAGG